MNVKGFITTVTAVGSIVMGAISIFDGCKALKAKKESEAEFEDFESETEDEQDVIESTAETVPAENGTETEE